MDYGVCFKVDARLYVHVDAVSIEEARELAEQEISSCDLNELEWIESEPIYINDENGDIVWEQ